MADVTYRLVAAGDAIECLICSQVSWSAVDVREHYCGHCGVFHDDVSPEELLRITCIMSTPSC